MNKASATVSVAFFVLGERRKMSLFLGEGQKQKDVA
jgi:hypothetical protein